MGRWGEEEKKSKGLIGCFIWAGIFGLVAFTFYINFPEIEARRTLEKDMQEIVRTGIGEKEEYLIAKIIEAAEKQEVILQQDQVELDISPDNYGNFIIDCRIDYPLKVNLLITTFDVNVPIVENVTLIP